MATSAMEFDSNIQLKDLFDKPEYSDLAIKLNDGREIHVHKFIVCARNDYFLKLSGLRSDFAESKQKTVELKDDDPTALEHVLRYLYGLGLPVSDHWKFWMNLHVTADKYLIPKLSAVASDKFYAVARTCNEADDVFDIIEACRNELNQNDVFIELADELREKHLITLLGNDRFRAQLDSGGKEALWQQLDELTANGGFKGKEEKSFTLCHQHQQTVFQGQLGAKEVKGYCTCCYIARNYGYNGYHYTSVQQVAKRVWMDE